MKGTHEDKESGLPFNERLEKAIKRKEKSEKYYRQKEYGYEPRKKKAYKYGICPKCNAETKFDIEELYSTCMSCDKTFFTSRIKK